MVDQHKRSQPVLLAAPSVQDWAKPPGSGVDRVPKDVASNKAAWNSTTFKVYDPVAAAIIDNINGIADGFFWSHHTFTHENLDNATFYDVDQQMDLNMEIAASHYLNLSQRETFSSKCMVTPQISGLRNGDALSALAQNGIICATGDNTWPFLVNQDNVHHMLYTTSDDNGFDGFAILPRSATEVYFNCSTPEQNMQMYNSLYEAHFGGPSTFDDLLQREATRVVREGLLLLNKNPHMMHQANLGILDGSGKSLAMRWVEAVLAEFKKFVTWPVKSLKLDDLYAMYKAREARDACDLSYTLNIADDDGAVQSVTIKSAATPTSEGGSCSAPLMLGGDTGTLSVPVSIGGSASVALSPAAAGASVVSA